MNQNAAIENMAKVELVALRTPPEVSATPPTDNDIQAATTQTDAPAGSLTRDLRV